MIEFAMTLANLRDIIAHLIECVGEDAPVGILQTREPPEMSATTGRRGATMSDLIQLELVYIDQSGKVVGDEANDYEKRVRPGEVAAVMIS